MKGASGVLQGAQDPPAADAGLPEGFFDLQEVLEAITRTPGCLGVEMARTPGAKMAVFAWFENKQGLLNWYNSDAHREGMKQYFGLQPAQAPIQNTPDNGAPILAIASFTVADKAHFKETGLPLSQLAIELYQPLPGGIAAGGRFAPDTLRVPEMRHYGPTQK